MPLDLYGNHFGGCYSRGCCRRSGPAFYRKDPSLGPRGVYGRMDGRVEVGR